MNTVKLYKGDDFIIVDAGSGKERDLLAEGWKCGREKPAKARGQRQPGNAVGGAHEESDGKTPGADLPPAA